MQHDFSKQKETEKVHNVKSRVHQSADNAVKAKKYLRYDIIYDIIKGNNA